MAYTVVGHHAFYLRQGWSIPWEIETGEFVTHPTGEETLDLGVIDLVEWTEGLLPGLYLLVPVRALPVGDVPMPNETFILVHGGPLESADIPSVDVAARITGDLLQMADTPYTSMAHAEGFLTGLSYALAQHNGGKPTLSISINIEWEGLTTELLDAALENINEECAIMDYRYDPPVPSDEPGAISFGTLTLATTENEIPLDPTGWPRL